MIHSHAQGGEDFADAEAPRGAARGDLLPELRGAFLRLDTHIYMGVCMYMYIYVHMGGGREGMGLLLLLLLLLLLDLTGIV